MNRKTFIFGCLLCFASVAYATDEVIVIKREPAISSSLVKKIADAIYVAEGGKRAKVPYGILSVKVKDEAEARRVCENTIRNNYKRWIAAGKPNSYLKYLADKYCPPSVDKQGNINWLKNVKKHSGLDF